MKIQNFEQSSNKIIQKRQQIAQATKMSQIQPDLAVFQMKNDTISENIYQNPVTQNSYNSQSQIEFQSKKIHQHDKQQLSGQKQIYLKSKWSENLKSKGLEIQQNTIFVKTELTSNNNRLWQFSLIENGFDQKVKHKKCWVVKIIEKQGGMDLGVCLKNILQNYNFNYEDFNWFETGHGLYLQGSTGCCYHHELKQFNHVQKSFGFSKGDSIKIQYNPIEQKIRFRKNNELEIFEMDIPEPPINDAYHPCVAFHKQNDCVEISQGQFF